MHALFHNAINRGVCFDADDMEPSELQIGKGVCPSRAIAFSEECSKFSG